MDKHEVYNRLVELNANFQKCTKVSLINIVFPKWNELDIINDIFRQMVKTKEQPKGFVYDENEFRVVFRIYNGKIYDHNNKPDAYCWSIDDFIKKSKNIQSIGINSAEAILNLCSVLNTMSNEDEKKKLASMFSSFNKNLLYIESKEEDRITVEITEDLYNKGIISCIDEWCKEIGGEYSITQIDIGDFLIINHTDKTVYRIERDAFLATHILR